MPGLRNVIVHRYMTVDHELIYQFLHRCVTLILRRLVSTSLSIYEKIVDRLRVGFHCIHL